MSRSLLKTSFKTLLAAVGILLLVVIAYVLYVLLSYSRIPDNQPLTAVGRAQHDTVKVGESYTVVTQNMGFGAYTPDFTFFMDGGTESRAASAESVRDCFDKGLTQVGKFNPDFVLFQEIDLDSTRSFHIDQTKLVTDAFPAFQSVTAINYDSAYLMYPIFEPHGASKSSIVTLSRYAVTASTRRSFPISESLSKLLDLDRCYSLSRIAVENGKELVLYNVHASAYGSDASVRTAQMTMLLNDMKSEYDKGNYVVCGGDFNHDFTGDSTKQLNGAAADFDWAQPFPTELIPNGISRCINYTAPLAPTCRNCDIPYEDGNFTIIVDGFLVSDNVTCTALQNVQTDFAYSDHNPVVITFTLQ